MTRSPYDTSTGAGDDPGGEHNADPCDGYPHAPDGSGAAGVEGQTTGTAEAAAHWAALQAWVHWLVTRYALDHRDIPPCWARHGALAAELAALHLAHTMLVDPDAPPTVAADWHHTLDLTRRRLQQWAGRTGCRPGQHRDDQTPNWP